MLIQKLGGQTKSIMVFLALANFMPACGFHCISIEQFPRALCSFTTICGVLCCTVDMA